MDDQDLDRLEKIAKAATQEPWKLGGCDRSTIWAAGFTSAPGFAESVPAAESVYLGYLPRSSPEDLDPFTARRVERECEANAAHAIAFQPSAALALIAELRAARAERDEAVNALVNTEATS